MGCIDGCHERINATDHMPFVYNSALGNNESAPILCLAVCFSFTLEQQFSVGLLGQFLIKLFSEGNDDHLLDPIFKM